MLRKSGDKAYLLGRNIILPSFKQCNVLLRALRSGHDQTEDIPSNELKVHFLVKTFGSTHYKWREILKKYPDLKNLKKKDIQNTVRYLKNLNFTINEILEKPTVLHNSELTLRNRYDIMKECGMININVGFLAKYIAVVNRTAEDLKYLGHLPLNIDIKENLRQSFKDIDLKLPKSNDNSIIDGTIKLTLIRQSILNYYLQQRLDMSPNDIQKLWKVYGRIKHKSFMSIQNMVKLLLNDLKYSKERIKKNAFILYGDAENVQQIIKQIPNIGSQSILEILYKRPKIFMSPCDTLIATLKNIKDFGINEESVLKCLEVLTLSSDTVLERLRDMNDIEEFQALKSNPRILRLVHYQNKARLRLEYLNQLKVRCASLHILSCASDTFIKFAKDGTDRTRGRDVVVFLAKTMNKEESNIRSLLSRHPNWCHVPVIHIKQCYEFLLKQKFSVSDIYNNLYILLYPINRIDEKLQQIQSTNLLQELCSDIQNQIKSISKSDVLKLVLYLIEIQYHFTGDGIWGEQINQHVENFHNLLPDFPENVQKICRYGYKSPTRTDAVL